MPFLCYKLQTFVPSGHEAAGTVVKVGSDVVDVLVGDRIAIENHFFCENCYSCEVTRYLDLWFKYLSY